jgi:selT/selW/selH-like putative selenoprotein
VEAELKAKYPDAGVELIEGRGGIFDIFCNDRLIYSKQQRQRFPVAGEIGTLIEEGIP